MDLILASTSPYRRRLLERLRIPFRCVTPQVDETPLPGELPDRLARRLATAKAAAVSAENPGALVIGSDQVASINGSCIGKPGGHAAAAAQLQASAGRQVDFYTAVALLGDGGRQAQCELVPFTVHFRNLEQAEIERYLRAEQPYDCAGSFKCEGLGIALFERMSGDDPTALEGLPLITLAEMLRAAGIALP
jgi:septum formation protein